MTAGTTHNVSALYPRSQREPHICLSGFNDCQGAVLLRFGSCIILRFIQFGSYCLLAISSNVDSKTKLITHPETRIDARRQKSLRFYY